MERNTIKQNLEKRIEAMDITRKEAAAIMGITRNTLGKRLNHPGEFTVGELIAFCRYVGIGLKELLKF